MRKSPHFQGNPATAPSPFTVSTTPPSVNPAVLPEGFAKKTTGRAAPHPTPPPCRHPPPDATPQRTAPSARRRRPPKAGHPPARYTRLGIPSAASPPPP